MEILVKQARMTEFNEAFKIETNSITANTEYAYQSKDKHWKHVLIGTCSADGNITFKAGDSVLADGDVVVPVKSGTFAITIEDALAKVNRPYEVITVVASEGVTQKTDKLMDVVRFKSSVALTNVMIVKLP